MRYGGPYLGIMACREAVRPPHAGPHRRPNGRPPRQRCWVLTLQTREQHIRREKATSNICTNQGLFALRATIYLAAAGPARACAKTAELVPAKVALRRRAAVHGRRSLRWRSTRRRSRSSSSAIRQGRVDELLADACDAGYLAGVPLGQWYPELDDCFLVAVTEKRTKAEIDGWPTSLGNESAARGARSGFDLASRRPHAISHAKHSRHATAVRTLQAGPPRARAAGVRRAGRAARRAAAGGSRRRRAAAAAGAGRAGRRAALHQPVDAEHVGRHALLSARLVHDEVQPQAERAAGRAAGHCRPASAISRRTRCKGMLRIALRAAADPGRDRRPAGRVAAAGRRRAGRADGAAGRRGLLPRSRRAAHQGARPRQRPRHQPGQRRDGRLRHRHGEEHADGLRRPGRPAGASSTTRSPCS